MDKAMDLSKWTEGYAFIKKEEPKKVRKETEWVLGQTHLCQCLNLPVWRRLKLDRKPIEVSGRWSELKLKPRDL